MNETMILYCVAAVMSTLGGIVLFKEARKRKKAIAEAEAEFKAEDEAAKLAKTLKLQKQEQRQRKLRQRNRPGRRSSGLRVTENATECVQQGYEKDKCCFMHNLFYKKSL